MALNKKERLFKEVKKVFDNLDSYFDQVKKRLDIIYIGGYHCRPIVNSPLMTYENFWTMCNTYKTALSILSDNNEKKMLFKTKGLACTPFSPILLKSQLLDMLNYSRFMPWKLNVNFPKDLTNLTKSQKRAYLYCASESENSEWLDFYDKEDEVDSLTNIILSIGKHQIENMILHRNLKASSLQIFEKLFAKLDKNIYRITIQDFEIAETTTIKESYLKAIKPSNTIKEGDYKDILTKFIKELEVNIFKGLDWNSYMKKNFLNKYFQLEKVNKNEFNKKTRWDTSNSISREDCSNLIEYFYNEYKKDPIKRYYLGEVLCIIWILLWSSQEFEIETSVKEIVYLETKNLSDEGTILLNKNQEFDISEGLKTILHKYVNKDLKKSKRIFSITIDRLEDLFKKASEKILPKKAIPIMPASLLAFPHLFPKIRLNPCLRQQQYQKIKNSNVKVQWKAFKNNIILK